MTLRLDDRWIWDFWLARDGADHHVFFLQADRSLGDPDLRHWNVSIGHAVSQDLSRWETLPDALQPGRPGAWDDYTTWTGSVVRDDDRWHLLYTGATRSERGLVQRIGLATSDDLVHWDRHPENPVITADPTWYELLDLEAWHDQAWRDPWVLRHPETGDFHALITARARSGPPDGRGVIGHARSRDLAHWEVLPPLTEPGEFGQLEVPQLVALDGRWFLLFSTDAATHSTERRERTRTPAETGTYALVSDAPLGPFHSASDEALVTGGDTLYAGKIAMRGDDDPVFLAFRAKDARGMFVGELIDPLPIAVGDDGALRVG